MPEIESSFSPTENLNALTREAGERGAQSAREAPPREAVAQFEREMRRGTAPSAEDGAERPTAQRPADRPAPQRTDFSSLFRMAPPEDEAASKRSAGREARSEPSAKGSPAAAREPERHDIETGGVAFPRARGKAAPARYDDAKPLSSEELERLAAEALLGRGEPALEAKRAASATAAAPAPSAPSAALDGEALEALVSRILVSTPETGAPEVRLTLAGHALAGTEVSIARELDGRLAVKLSAGDPSAFQTLVAGRDDLARLLGAGERLPVNIQIEAREDGSEGSESSGQSDPQRQSSRSRREDGSEEQP